jgi:hypothetical protein
MDLDIHMRRKTFDRIGSRQTQKVVYSHMIDPYQRLGGAVQQSRRRGCNEYEYRLPACISSFLPASLRPVGEGNGFVLFVPKLYIKVIIINNCYFRPSIFRHLARNILALLMRRKSKRFFRLFWSRLLTKKCSAAAWTTFLLQEQSGLIQAVRESSARGPSDGIPGRLRYLDLSRESLRLRASRRVRLKGKIAIRRQSRQFLSRDFGPAATPKLRPATGDGCDGQQTFNSLGEAPRPVSRGGVIWHQPRSP